MLTRIPNMTARLSFPWTAPEIGTLEKSRLLHVGGARRFERSLLDRRWGPIFLSVSGHWVSTSSMSIRLWALPPTEIPGVFEGSSQKLTRWNETAALRSR